MADLCEQHGVTIVLKDRAVGGGSRADTKGKRILIEPVTGVRSYYTALHEIAHCVQGWDETAPAAPQEAAAWEWGFQTANEPPSDGVKRHVFRVLWHYLLADFDPRPQASPDARAFPEPDSPFWAFLARLDADPGRLLYEAAKLTYNVG